MNWGNKLVLTFIVFASGMGYLVYRSTQVHFDLADKNYYKSELRYQQVIDGTNRVNQLNSRVKLEQDKNRLVLQLPEEMNGKSITGDIWFYCPYDEKKDKRSLLETDPMGRQEWDLTAISPGNYNVKISWNCNGKSYFSEKKLTVH